MTNKMIIMVGCPGSGKSTWAKKNYPGAVQCSADHYFMIDSEYKFDVTKLGKAHGTCFRKSIESAQAGKCIVIDNTNSSISEVSPYYALAQAYGLDVHIVFIKCDVNIAFERGTHGVPLANVKAIDKRCKSFVLPKFWNVIKIIVDM